VPLDLIVSEGLKRFNEVNVHVVWQKALERRITDPEGAITSARRAMSFSRKPIAVLTRIRDRSITQAY
jgi:hypothetical protein